MYKIICDACGTENNVRRRHGHSKIRTWTADLCDECNKIVMEISNKTIDIVDKYDDKLLTFLKQV